MTSDTPLSGGSLPLSGQGGLAAFVAKIVQQTPTGSGDARIGRRGFSLSCRKGCAEDAAALTLHDRAGLQVLQRRDHSSRN